MSPERLPAEPDEWLIERFKATGNTEYFGTLVRRHGRSIFARCYQVLRSASDAEDVTQDAFVAAFTKINLYQGGAFLPWLYTIARNLCLNRLKSRMTRHESTGLDDADGAESSSFEINSRLADECLYILNELSEPQRLSLKLFYIEGYTYEEISRITGFSNQEVKTHLQNGRRRFRLVWEKTHKRKGAGE